MKGRRLRNGLVGTQVALALTLMIVSGLFARSIAALFSQELGFDETGLLTTVIEIPEDRYPSDDDVLRFFETVREEVADMPRVAAAGLTSGRPILFEDRRATPFVIESQPPPDDRSLPWAIFTIAQGSYLEALQVPLLQGRRFEAQDGVEAPGAAIVSQAMARRYWGSGSPLGDRVRLGGDPEGEWLTVVGVVADVELGADGDLARPDHLYAAFQQRPQHRMVLVARSTGAPEALTASIREVVRGIDPGQPIDDVRTMGEVLYDRQAPGIAITMLFGVFAVFALVMAATGIYGVMSYMVSERTGEISLRMALGAAREDVIRMIMSQGMRVLAIGGLVGLVGALVLNQLMSSVVWGVSPRDPLTYGVVTGSLVLVAVIANLVPALRATRIEPMEAMRVE